jgi:hypothetical protein
MRKSNLGILNGMTGEQLFLLAIANAGLRRGIGRELDQRARAARRRPSAVAHELSLTPPCPALTLRRAG